MSPGAERMRASRERARRHRRLLTVEVSDDLPDALVEAKLLAEWDAENWPEIERAVERVLDALVRKHT